MRCCSSLPFLSLGRKALESRMPESPNQGMPWNTPVTPLSRSFEGMKYQESGDVFRMRIKRISSERSLVAMNCCFSGFLQWLFAALPNEPGPEATSGMVRGFFALDVTWYESLGGGLLMTIGGIKALLNALVFESRSWNLQRIFGCFLGCVVS